MVFGVVREERRLKGVRGLTRESSRLGCRRGSGHDRLGLKLG